jgi:hypothetical protein
MLGSTMLRKFVLTGSMWMSSSTSWRLTKRTYSLKPTLSTLPFASPWTSLLHLSSTTLGRCMATHP